jgi:hypothetical protein
MRNNLIWQFSEVLMALWGRPVLLQSGHKADWSEMSSLGVLCIATPSCD